MVLQIGVRSLSNNYETRQLNASDVPMYKLGVYATIWYFGYLLSLSVPHVVVILPVGVITPRSRYVVNIPRVPEKSTSSIR